MKKFFTALFFVMALCSQATHIAGGEITYKCLGKDSFLVTVSLYRDCGGVPMPSLIMEVHGLNCGYLKTFNLKKIGCGDVTPVCSNACSQCDLQNCNSNNNNSNCTFPYGTEKMEYTATIGLSTTKCTNFRLQFGYSSGRSGATTCCAGENFFIEAYLDKTKQSNSPVFDETGIPIICSGNCTDISFHASDADGDSLSYHLVPALEGTGSSCYYVNGYAYNRPLKFSGHPNFAPSAGCYGFRIDSTTGLIKFKPTQQQTAFVVCEVREWRKDSTGKLKVIGKVVRDMQVIVMANCANSPPIFNTQTSLEFCGLDSVKLSSIVIVDSNTIDTVRAAVTSGFTGLKWTTKNQNNPNFKTVDLEFLADSTWANGESRRVFITATDDACPLPGKRHEAITFTRNDGPRMYIKPIRVFNCLSYTIIWSKKSSNLQEWAVFDSAATKYYTDTFTHTFSKQGHFVIGAKIQFGGCSGWVYDTLAVGYDTIPENFLGIDTQTCSSPLVLVAPDLKTGPVFWSNGTISLATKIHSSGMYTCLIRNAVGCTFIDTINAIVGAVKPNLGPDIILCKYDSVTFDAGVGFKSYTWSTGEKSQSIRTDQLGTHTCTTIDTNGCSSFDRVALFRDIVIKPILPQHISICPGGTTLLDAGSGYAKYKWSNGSTTQRIWVSSAGNFGVKVFNAFGCNDSASTSVSLLPPPMPPSPTKKCRTVFCSRRYMLGRATTTGFLAMVMPAVCRVRITATNWQALGR